MMKMFRKNKKGFTLIELIVVVAILGILAAVAIPSFIGISNEAEATVTLSNARNIATAINTYNALNPTTKIAPSGETAPAFEATKSTLDTAGLWPVGIEEGDKETACWALVSVSSDGVATAAEPTT